MPGAQTRLSTLERASCAMIPPMARPRCSFGERRSFACRSYPAPVDSGVVVVIGARDVPIAPSRPMDVSITNQFAGAIVEMEALALPYVRVTFDLTPTNRMRWSRRIGGTAGAGDGHCRRR